MALFVESHGLWFLLVPVAWTAWFALTDDRRHLSGMDVGGIRAGVLITALLLAFFAYAALMSMQAATTMHGPLQINE